MGKEGQRPNDRNSLSLPTQAPNTCHPTESTLRHKTRAQSATCPIPGRDESLSWCKNLSLSRPNRHPVVRGEDSFQLGGAVKAHRPR